MDSTNFFRAPFRLFSLICCFLLLSACRLTVSISGDGAGEVVSDDGAIKCGNQADQCEAQLERLSVVLTATAREGSQFVGWAGDCEGQEAVCELQSAPTMAVTARFEADEPDREQNCGTEGARARCLEPKQSPDYYIDQSIKYFLTMQSDVSPFVQPNYSDLVVRWEWPPWLLLTGYGRFNLIWTDIVLKLNPTAYAMMDCQAFDQQPFGRCHVVFDYNGELCPIYEEFTFNDAGEITFIEAWTDAPGWLPMSEQDYWAEGEGVDRLATRVPGLGNAEGRIDLEAAWMEEVAAKDADVAEFVRRAKRPYAAWLNEMVAHPVEVAQGCDPNGTHHQ